LTPLNSDTSELTREPARARQRVYARLEPLLLWLWKVLPIPQRGRRAYLELTHPRFLIGVMAVIRDEQGQLLILEHTYRRHHVWGLPGGYLQSREAPEKGLRREVREEIGLEIDVGELLGAALFSPHQLDLLYSARVLQGGLRASPEVRGWQFVRPEELGAILPNQLSMLRRAGLASAADRP
jgi:8-oxo-dGTP diphosphatase